MSSAAPTLSGQDVGEAEGALTSLLERVLARSNTGLSRTTYIALRVLALRGSAQSLAAFRDFLASQPQLALDRAQAAELVQTLERDGVITTTSTDGPESIQLTPKGAALHASVAEAVLALTRRLYADLDAGDLATAHNVLAEVTQRATRLRDEF
jgi:DNA-binding MarR family transcriptional regulator